MNHRRDFCVLCSELTDSPPFSVQAGVRKPDEERILIDDTPLVMMHDISPVIDGHSLIVSRLHINSFAEFPSLSKLQSAMRKVLELLGRYKSPVLFFEHGSNTNTPGKMNCVNHAHIHCIPVDLPILEYIVRYSGPESRIVETDVLSLEEFRGSDYLLYSRNADDCTVLVNPEKPLPRQLIRMIVSSYANTGDWDWRNVLYTGSPQKREVSC